MTLASYIHALDDAYSREQPGDVIHAVKQAVINQVRDVDPRVTIKSTEFFSHSFAPDLILSWKSSDTERQLFVRQDVSSDYFIDDLRRIGDHRPIVFNLEPHSPIEQTPERQEVVRISSALLTDAGGLQEISSRKRGSKVIEIAAPVLLQGGRGDLDEPGAERLSSGLTRGFIAAGAAATDETRDAVALVQEAFGEEHSARIVEFLRAVWIGGGGHASDFPASAADVQLTDEALNFLLEFEANADLSYWRRVGSGLTIDRISALSPQPSRNLDRLMLANLDRITARFSSLDNVADDLFSQGQNAWRAEGGSLVWRGENIAVRFNSTRDSAAYGFADLNKGIRFDLLMKRARRRGIPLEQLEFISSSRRIDYASESSAAHQDVTFDVQLAAMAESLGPSGIVSKATAVLPGGRTLTCDFRKTTASGRTAAKYPLRELFAYAVPLLVQLTEPDREAIDILLTENRGYSDEDFQLF